jgi:hypothetical protein
MKHWVLFRGVVLCLLLALLLGGVTQAGAPRPAATWSIQVVDQPGYGGAGISLVLDSDGWPHISYAGQNPGYIFGVKYAYYDGTAWQIEMADENGDGDWGTSLVLDSLGDPHIAYHVAHSALRYAHYYNSSWHIMTVDSGADVGEHPSLALNSAGLPRIAYADQTNLAIKYARRTGPNWAIETVTTISNTGQLVFVAMALDPTDHPHLCYYVPMTPADDLLNYAYYDGTAWHFQTVDSHAWYNGQDCAIALDSQGHPHIAYISDGLQYASYDGSTWSITTVGTDYPGSHVSLAFDASDLPHIAYPAWDSSSDFLRYAYFDGFDWQIETVDTAGETSRYEDTSLALDWAGQPRIAYLDLGPSDLKYATTGGGPIVGRVFLPIVNRH